MKFKSNVEAQAKVFIGDVTSANATRFPNALSVTSVVPSGIQQDESMYIGQMGEALSSGSTWASGLYGAGYTNTSGTGRGTGVTGEGHVSSATDTGVAVGVRGYANDVHSGNYNIGLYGDATNGSTGLTYGGNVALFLANGNIVTSAAAAKSWYLGGNLTFDGQGSTKTIGVANGAKFDFGGTSSQFVKGDGTLDSTVYVPTTRTLTINGTTLDLSANRSWSVGTVTSVAALTLGTTGTDLSSTVATGTTTPVITLNVPTASAINRGALSATDWTTFNNKQNALTNPVTGTGVSNYIPKFNGTTSLTSSTIYDNISGVGINTTAPNYTTAGRGVIDINGTSQSMLSLSVGGVGKSFLFYTGTDLLVSNESNGAIKLNTNGSQKVVIEAGGNVGIGTTSPSAKLNVSGDIHIGDYGSAVNRLLDFRTNNSLFTITTYGTSGGLGTNLTYSWANGGGGPLTFSNSAGEVMRLSATGNLGIGATSPAEKLSVSGAIISTGGITGHGANRTSLSQEGSNGAYWQSYGADASTVGSFSLRQASSDFSINRVAMFINPSGNVGIGTTTPATKFAVSFSETYGLEVDLSGSNIVTLQAYNRSTSAYVQMDHDALFHRFSAGSSERMRITSGGNVGIGTTSPSQKLEVSGNVFTNGSLYGYTPSLSAYKTYTKSAQFEISSYQFISGSPYTKIMDIVSNADSGVASEMRFLTALSGGNPTEALRITSTGNVGIGTTSPTTQFESKNSAGSTLRASNTVGGYVDVGITSNATSTAFINFTNGISFSGGPATFGSTVTATGFFNSSDIRLKDLVDYNYDVNSIKAITYTWKDNSDSKIHIGYSAQEVQKALPDAVSEDDKGFLSVDYIQVLVAKIEMLEDRIKQLENGLE